MRKRLAEKCFVLTNENTGNVIFYLTRFEALFVLFSVCVAGGVYAWVSS